VLPAIFHDTMNTNSKEYQEHQIFEELTLYIEFYKSLSFSIMGFVSIGTKAFINIDTYIFSSIQGTVDSIKTLLTNGRINDSYALLRKYYDSTIINIYSSLYLQDNVSLDNFIVEKIDNWLQGKEQLPEYRVMNDYVRNSAKLKEINDLLFKDKTTYKDLRNRCNDHTHYNFYHNLLLNDNEVCLKNRITTLNQFSADLRNIFILHCSYLFYLNEHYMTSSDYMDSFECGLEPEEGSQYFVAPFIQNAFDKTIKTYRQDIAKLILDKTCMQLE
jgi:hypothetical protein